jgi:uncharacterized protein
MSSSTMIQKLTAYLAADADFRAVYDYTRERFEAAKQLYAHNFEHCRRDTLNAIAIGEPEGADMHVVLCAAVMHDIGYLYGGRGDHGEVGAAKLAEYLSDGSISLDSATQSHIAGCIGSHKGAMHGIDPATLEAKVVADADHLDKYGPIGVHQVLSSLSEFGLSIGEIINRLANRRDLSMFTATATDLMRDRIQFTRDFYAAFIEAYEPYLEDQAK